MSVADGIFWLASYPKSGNTWMRVFLYNYITDATEPINVNKMRATPIASGRGLLDRYLGTDSSEFLIDEIDTYRPDIYAMYAQSNTPEFMLGDHRIVKVHDAFHYLPDGRPLFPPAITRGAIYLIRNILDVAPSYAAHNSNTIDETITLMLYDQHKLAADTERHQNQVRQKLFTWSQHVNSWNSIPNMPCLIVRYEDMVQKPTETFGAVIRFLGMAVEDERLARAIDFSSFKQLKAQEDEDDFYERPARSERFFRKGKVGTWRESLSHEQVARLIQNSHDVMRRFGYMDTEGNLTY